MLATARAGMLAALVTLMPFAASAADKPYQRDDLADGAIKLEAQIKKDAGSVTKPIATLRREVDTAFGRNDWRTATQVLGQIVTLAPNEAAGWLRFSVATQRQTYLMPENERGEVLERASTLA